VAGVSELATVEYGVGHLNTPLLIVMGHTKCGAVTAVVEETELHGHLQALAEKIKPAVAKVKAEPMETEEAVPKAIQANVWQTIEDIIKQSSAVRSKVEAGQLSILGAIYDLEHGRVTWLGAHPAQDALIALAAQAETDAALARRLENSAGAKKDSHPARPSPAVPVAKTDEHSPSGQGTAPQGGGSKHH
jgi:carbonic anhydrase